MDVMPNEPTSTRCVEQEQEVDVGAGITVCAEDNFFRTHAIQLTNAHHKVGWSKGVLE
jgi:hypothetical protein